MQYDTIIVGAGSAGCVLANRLSADLANNVLLIEAGPDMPHGKIPEVLLDSYPGAAYINKAYNWDKLRVTTNAQADQTRLKPYEQARLVGGGSSINAQLANRGSQEDYDEWQARGADGWTWASVLPYFKKLERDMDFEGPAHGTGGRIPVRRIFPDLWPGHITAVASALDATGVPYIADQNAGFDEGYFPIAMSNAYERRVSASIAYLDPMTRQRKNLTILADTEVSRLLFEGDRCIGVETQQSGETGRILANQVIVSCGAIHSPAMLLRSGIGPASELQKHGITVVKDLPGVGKGLMEHPMVAVASFLDSRARVNSFSRRHILLGWRYSSGIGNETGDMNIVFATRSAWHDVGAQIGSALIILNKPCSEDGEVTLKSSNWREPPRVDFKFLTDNRDLERLMDGFYRVAALHKRPELAAVAHDAFPAVWGEKVRQVGAITLKNRLYTWFAAKLLDGPKFLSRAIFAKFVMGKYRMESALKDPEHLKAFVNDGVAGAWHPSSSCRMGASSDRMAVTDSAGKVHGIKGLRVVDASIFPSIPRANLNFPVIMVAERMADLIRNDNEGRAASRVKADSVLQA